MTCLLIILLIVGISIYPIYKITHKETTSNKTDNNKIEEKEKLKNNEVAT